MTMKHLLAGLVAALAFMAPAQAFDLQSTPVPGRVPGTGGFGTPLTAGEIAINRADKRLIFKNVDGTLGYGSLLNALASGRKAIEQGDASDLTLGSGGPTLPSALGTKAPLASPAFTGVVSAPVLATSSGLIAPGLFYAKAHGSCAWTQAGDVGPCVNAAINAAAAAGGGEVVIDGGLYGQATPIVNTTSGVRLRGAGVGDPRGTVDPYKFLATTRLLWNGAAGATMYSVGPAGGDNKSLHGSGVDGITFDCNSIAAVCAKITQVSHATFRIGAAEPTYTGIWTTTATIPDGPGTQDNDIWFYSRVTTPTSKATGIFLDGNSDNCSVPGGTCWNTSYNRFHKLLAFRTSGDGIVFGDSDNNIITDIGVYAQPGTMGGVDTVFASDRYVSPNGQQASNLAYNNLMIHAGSIYRMGGFRASSVVAINGANTGSGQITTVVKAATSAKTYDLSTKSLDFANTTGILPGMSVDCGGQQSGVLPGNTVASVASTNVTLSSIIVGNVTSGRSCSFSYGVTSKAAPGTYTLTANSASSFTLTAPAGGNSQSGVAPASGALTFTDMVLPFSGTPAVNDKWTITVKAASRQNVVNYIDKANGVPNPMWEPGATGAYSTSFNLMPAPGSGGSYAPSGGATGAASGTGSFAAGDAPSASGLQAMALGNCSAVGDFSTCIGPGVTASGFGSYGNGLNAIASGNVSVAVGNGVTASGIYGVATGYASTDRGDTAVARATGQFAAQGDAQTRSAIYRGVVTGTATVRLTTDGGTPTAANGLRVPENTMIGYVLDQVVCVDAVSRINWARWGRIDGAIAKVFGVGGAYNGGASTATPPSQGYTLGSNMSLLVSFDATNNVYALAVTGAPGATANPVRCVADVRAIEVQ